MRPVLLSVKAFGPYAGSVSVDFRDAIDAGLFGIYGATGSGKSSIFNAITFALFGDAAKSEQESSSLRSDLASPSEATEVQLIFDIAEKRYVVRRRPEQFRQKQKGGGETRAAHEAWLFDATGLSVEEIVAGNLGEVIEEKKVGVVNRAIEELLGYKLEQFKQIVLLPQGRFEKFLSAKTTERMAILRDLFDVSIFRRLAEKMKVDAEETVSQVTQGRQLCASLLGAEGFESVDALDAGLLSVEAEHLAQRDFEATCRTNCATAQSRLSEAQIVDLKFVKAETALVSLQGAQDATPQIVVMEERLKEAEAAQSIVDVEVQYQRAKSEFASATEKTAQKRVLSTTADDGESTALLHFENEREQSKSTVESARKLNELQQHLAAVEKSISIEESARNAADLADSAKASNATATKRVHDKTEERRRLEAALGIALQSERKTVEVEAKLSKLSADAKSAELYDKLTKDVEAAERNLAQMRQGRDSQAATTVRAREEYEEAERRLAEAQASHLAAKLVDGEPCLVCGSTTHPSPHVGRVEASMREQTFRKAREKLEVEEKKERGFAEKIASVEGATTEKKSQLSGQPKPAKSASQLTTEIEELSRTLADLKRQPRHADIEIKLRLVVSEIETAERERDATAASLLSAESSRAAEYGRLESILANVPSEIRTQSAIESAVADVKEEIATRERALKQAADALDSKRREAMEAKSELFAAEEVQRACEGRTLESKKEFLSRLEAKKLTEDRYFAVKASISRIESDRQTIDEHKQRLSSAKEQLVAAQKEIEDISRPDLQGLTTIFDEANASLALATESRATSAARLAQLRKLQSELAATIARLDKLEKETGALRDLAALFSAQNEQKITLETFAIWAMFDLVLNAANQRIGPMTAGRYELVREQDAGGRGMRGLEILVFDSHTGKSRSTSTLSGGESFIAALGLALGLADVVEGASGKVRLDTIFIDEGFGTLDSENGSGTLEQVLQVLNTLVSQNRAVGIISHVQGVQDAIPNGFYVRSSLSGSSVEVRGTM